MNCYYNNGGWIGYANDHNLPVELPDVPDEIDDDDANVIDCEYIDFDSIASDDDRG